MSSQDNQNVFNQQSRLQQNLAKTSSSPQLVKEIKENCTCTTIRQIVRDTVMYQRTFSDALEEEKYKYYKPKVQLGDIIELLEYLSSQTTTRKKSVFDLASFKTDATTHIEIGQGEVKYYGKNEKVVSSPGSVLGGTDAYTTISTIMSVSAKIKGGKEDYKKVTFAKENALAPSEALTVLAASISTMKSATSGELDAFVSQIKSLPAENKIDLFNRINTLAPIVVGSTGPGKILNMSFDPQKGPSLQLRKPSGTRNTLTLDYDTYVKNLGICKMGTKHPGFKRVARSAWTGTPNETFPYDHIACLHEAGVKVDKWILVVSADANLLSILRANFGKHLFGVGSGPFLIPPHTTSSTYWDYVYYPNPISCSLGKFQDTMSSLQVKAMKVLSNYAHGEIIYHISPVSLYCREIAEIIGSTIEEEEVKVEPKTTYNAFTDRVGVVYHPTTEESYNVVTPRKIPSGLFNYLCEDGSCVMHTQRKQFVQLKDAYIEQDGELKLKPSHEYVYVSKETLFDHLKQNAPATAIELAQFYTRYPTMYQKFQHINNFSCVTPEEIARTRLYAKSSPMTYNGLMMCSDEVTSAEASFILGEVLSVMREAYKAIWSPGFSTLSRYKIRLSLISAAISSLTFDDEYSALYGATQVKVFEMEDKQMIENLTIQSPYNPVMTTTSTAVKTTDLYSVGENRLDFNMMDD